MEEWPEGGVAASIVILIECCPRWDGHWHNVVRLEARGWGQVVRTTVGYLVTDRIVVLKNISLFGEKYLEY